MMSVVIPFKSFPSFIENITLDDIVLNFKFIWNGRDNAWYMDISDSINDPILQGIKVINGWELIARYTDIRLPQGALLVVSLNSDEEIIDRNGMIDNYSLIYLTEEELDASV